MRMNGWHFSKGCLPYQSMREGCKFCCVTTGAVRERLSVRFTKKGGGGGGELNGKMPWKKGSG